MPKPKVPRSQVGPDEVLCEYCTAKCCRYFALPIDTPENWDDFEHLRWYMLHGKVSLFVEDDTWYLMVHADCQALQPDNMCGIYDERPGICRAYTTDECEYDDDACYEKFFETPDQIWEYAEAVLPPRKKKKQKEPAQLPVLTVV